MQSTVVKRSIWSNDSFVKDAFHALLFDQKFVETEETHDV